MAVYGYLACNDCREIIFLGKWLHGESENEIGLGFWHGVLCGDRGANAQPLGEKALRFLSHHMNHSIAIVRDETEEDDYYAEYTSVNDKYEEGIAHELSIRRGFIECPFCKREFLEPCLVY